MDSWHEWRYTPSTFASDCRILKTASVSRGWWFVAGTFHQSFALYWHLLIRRDEDWTWWPPFTLASSFPESGSALQGHPVVRSALQAFASRLAGAAKQSFLSLTQPSDGHCVQDNQGQSKHIAALRSIQAKYLNPLSFPPLPEQICPGGVVRRFVLTITDGQQNVRPTVSTRRWIVETPPRGEEEAGTIRRYLDGRHP